MKAIEMSIMTSAVRCLMWTALAVAALDAGAQSAPAKKAAEPAPPAGAAEKAASTMLVFDASGSMWGQIDGKSKIEIARQAAGKYVAGLPAGQPLGLVVYGHREKDDCADIETLIPAGTTDRAALMRKLDAIKPRGKTPISQAVRQAAEVLDYTRQPATVVVVTDGVETCNADPCAAATALAKAGKKLTIHMIGFDVKAGERSHLQCFARATGGQFVLASNASDLHLALQKVSQPVEAGEAVDSAVKLTANPASPKAGSKFNVAWTGVTEENDLITLSLPEVPVGGGLVSLGVKKTATATEMRAPEEPGDYELRFVRRTTGKLQGKLALTVVPAEASVRAAAVVEGNRSFEVEWTGPANAGDVIHLVDPAAPGTHLAYANTQSGSRVKLQAPARSGEYEVRYVAPGGKALARQRVTVAMEPIVLKVASPVKKGQPFTVELSGSTGSGDFISIAPAGSHRDTRVSYRNVEKAGPVRLTAPAQPGKYELRYFGASNNFGVLATAALTVD